MAKSIRNGVMMLDAAGQGFSGRPVVDYSVNADGSWVTNPANQIVNCQQRVNCITVHPSAGSWVCALSNQDGTLVFSANGSTADAANFFGPWDFNGVVATTMTNMTRVELNFDYIEW